MDIPADVKNIDIKFKIYEVELQKCCDWLAYTYTEEGWHYFKSLINQFIYNQELQYEESVLKYYYEHFQPTNLGEALLFEDDSKTFPLFKTWRLPWENITPSPKPKKSGNYQHFGPNSLAFGKFEFSRIIKLYKKLQHEGYQPDKNRDGYITGYFLKKDTDYRFLITTGQHRMPSLGALGYSTIKVKTHPRYSCLIDIQDASKWKNVRNGLYTEDQAREVFNIYFNMNGREKAAIIGLDLMGGPKLKR